MFESVATIVAPQEGGLTPQLEKQAAQIIRGLSVERLKPEVLEPGKAVDIYFGGVHPELHGKVRKKLSGLGAFDVFVQFNDLYRKKKLLIADMDATIIQGESLDELADHLKIRDKIAPITEQAMRGEIDFEEALKQRVLLLKGLAVTALFETVGNIKYSPGAETLVKTMSRFGMKCVLVSGGFDVFTRHVAGALGFHKSFGNRLGIHADRLTGEVIPPIVDKEIKRKMLENEARNNGIEIGHIVAIGDGANDIPMLQAAGAGVGYFAKPAVQEAVPHQIRHTDLTSVLYMQGYKKREFVG